MDIRRITLIAGIGFILAGILGFIPGITSAPHVHDPNLAVDASYGRLLGLFPVNAVHNLVHLALGIWALSVYKNINKARAYCRIASVLYGVLAISGLIPGLNTMFGLVPIHSHDVWLHAAFAGVLGYFGFVKSNIGNRVDAVRTTADANFRWS